MEEQLLSAEFRSEAAVRHMTSTTATPLLLTKRKSDSIDDKSSKAPKTKRQRKKEREEQKRQKISRAQEKRVGRLKAKTEKREKRQQLLSSLSQNALSADQMKLLHSTSSLGQKQSLKHTLRRAFVEKQALGYSLTEAPLEKSVTPKPTVGLCIVQNSFKEKRSVVRPDSHESPSVVKDADVSEPVQTISQPAAGVPETLPTAQTRVETSAPQPAVKAALHRESPAVNVPVVRDPNVQKQRAQLPIFMEEQRIMEAIGEHDVVIVCGETGSGKTTQVPQFLYEAGFGSHQERPGMIGVTQPRRVAAVSMATRVAEELNSAIGSLVAYQIRFDSSVSHQSKIKFMTDGILLKEIQSDFLLRSYSVIIIDEAHERNLNTDILIGLLSRIVPLRRKLALEEKQARPVAPLKLVIMSATLRVDDFVANPGLFPVPPVVLSVDARQHPVTVHFNRRTPTDYVDEAFRKVLKIHTKLPAGGILVFLSGQQEIERLCKELKATQDVKVAKADGIGPLHVLPLYSALPTRKQLQVFDAPPEGARLVVVATNVAETSLTIPLIKYVVDTGKVKEKRYDRTSGVSTYRVSWTSAASANQRAGRAGRTGPGHAYRLYSSAVFNDQFMKFSEPEINRIPIEGVVLQMKSMGIDKIMSFPFPTPPDQIALAEALKLLRSLGAIDEAERITPMGRTLASLPLAPRFAKMLVLGRQGGCLSYALSVVAALSVEEPLLLMPHLGASGEQATEPVDEAEERRRQSQRIHSRHAPWKDPKSDALTLLRAIGAATFAARNPGQLEKFCTEHYLNEKVLKEILALRDQLCFMVQDAYGEECPLEGLPPPTPDQEILLRQLIAAGLVDQVARKCENVREGTAGMKYQLSRASEGWIHPSSSVSETSPEWVVYTSIVATSRPFMRAVTAIHPSWLVELAPSLCDMGNPLESPSPRYEPDALKCWVHVRYGIPGWELGLHEIPMPPSTLRYKYFMRFLLEGKVFPSLGTLREQLLGKPSMITASTQTNHRTLALLLALSSNDVYSRETLLQIWNKDKEFLLPELKLWVKPESWPTLASIWALLNK